MDEISAALTEEELSFCISAVELEIREVKEQLNDRNITKSERIEANTYIQKMESFANQLEHEANQLKSFDLLHMYQLVQKERVLLEDMLDNSNLTGGRRQNAQRFLRTANSLTRKLKHFFKGFGIDV